MELNGREVFTIAMPSAEGNTFDWEEFRMLRRTRCADDDHVFMYYYFSTRERKNYYRCCECGKISS